MTSTVGIAMVLGITVVAITELTVNKIKEIYK